MDSTSTLSFPRAAGTHMRFSCAVLLALAANFIWADGHDQQRVVELVMMLAAGIAVLVAPQAVLGDAMRGAFNKPLIAFFALGLVSSLFAFAPRFAFFEVASFFLLYVFARLIGQEIARVGTVYLLWTLRAMALACAVYSLKFVGHYIASLSSGAPFDYSDFSSGFSNLRFFNHVQTITLPLLILLCTLTVKRPRMHWAWLALTAYWWMALFATGGRGTLVGVSAGLAAVALLRWRPAAPFLKHAVWSAVAGLVAYFVLLVLVPKLTGGTEIDTFSVLMQRTASDPTSARLPLWRDAIHMMIAHPWLGVGPMHFAHRMHELFSAAHPHDWVMQIGSEWGIPALLCLCAAIAHAGKTLLAVGPRIAPGDHVNQAIHVGLLGTGIAILVDGLVSGLFVMPQSRLAIVLYLGCAIGWYKAMSPRTGSAGASPRANTMAASLLVAAALAAVAVAVYPDVLAQASGQPLAPAQAALNVGLHWPRLWEAGFF